MKLRPWETANLKALKQLWQAANPEARTAAKFNLALSLHFALDLLNQWLHWHWFKVALALYFWSLTGFGYWWAFKLRQKIMQTFADEKRRLEKVKLSKALDRLVFELDLLPSVFEQEHCFGKAFDLSDRNTMQQCFGGTCRGLNQIRHSAQAAKVSLQSMKGMS